MSQAITISNVVRDDHIFDRVPPSNFSLADYVGEQVSGTSGTIFKGFTLDNIQAVSALVRFDIARTGDLSATDLVVFIAEYPGIGPSSGYNTIDVDLDVINTQAQKRMIIFRTPIPGPSQTQLSVPVPSALDFGSAAGPASTNIGTITSDNPVPPAVATITQSANGTIDLTPLGQVPIISTASDPVATAINSCESFALSVIAPSWTPDPTLNSGWVIFFVKDGASLSLNAFVSNSANVKPTSQNAVKRLGNTFA